MPRIPTYVGAGRGQRRASALVRLSRLQAVLGASGSLKFRAKGSLLPPGLPSATAEGLLRLLEKGFEQGWDPAGSRVSGFLVLAFWNRPAASYRGASDLDPSFKEQLLALPGAAAFPSLGPQYLVLLTPVTCSCAGVGSKAPALRQLIPWGVRVWVEGREG